MSFIRDLYRGKLIPAEMYPPVSREFQAAAEKTKEIASKLQAGLNDEQWELYEEHENARSLREDAEQEEIFVLGFRLGLMLGNEVWKDDRLADALKEEVCQ